MRLKILTEFLFNKSSDSTTTDLKFNLHKEILVSKIKERISMITLIPTEHFSLRIKMNGEWSTQLDPSVRLMDAIPPTFFSRLRFWSGNKTPNSAKIKMMIDLQPRPGMISIWIQNINGTHFLVEIAPGDSLAMLQHVISTRTGFPPYKQRIYFSGKELNWYRSLGEQGIQEMDQVKLSLRRRIIPGTFLYAQDEDRRITPRFSITSRHMSVC